MRILVGHWHARLNIVVSVSSFEEVALNNNEKDAFDESCWPDFLLGRSADKLSRTTSFANRSSACMEFGTPSLMVVFEISTKFWAKGGRFLLAIIVRDKKVPASSLLGFGAQRSEHAVKPASLVHN